MDLEKFDFEAFKKSALDKLKAGQAPLGKDGAFTQESYRDLLGLYIGAAESAKFCMQVSQICRLEG